MWTSGHVDTKKLKMSSILDGAWRAHRTPIFVSIHFLYTPSVLFSFLFLLFLLHFRSSFLSSLYPDLLYLPGYSSTCLQPSGSILTVTGLSGYQSTLLTSSCSSVSSFQFLV